MPIYEYECQDCKHTFEALIRGKDAPAGCPNCSGNRLERLVSIPGIKSDGTRARALKAAQARDRGQGVERMHERTEYENHHD
ncbi:MAG: zinc ribbon domain-containing protein [Gemmatimonadota bacterium]